MVFEIDSLRERIAELKLAVSIALVRAMREEKESEGLAAVAALAEVAVEYGLRLGGKQFMLHILKDLTDQVKRSKGPLTDRSL